MKGRAVLAALVFAISASGPAGAAPETEEDFAEAMQGCWNRVSWSAMDRADQGYHQSSQLCLSGGVEGDLSLLDCAGREVTECSSREGHYAFRDETFWSDLGDLPIRDFLHHCDLTLMAGRQFTLHNCQWVDAPAGTAPIEDLVYERAVGQ